MTDITSALKKIQVEETKYAASVSEATVTKIGASINYVVDNYAPLTAIPLGALGSDVSAATFTFIAPYKCAAKGISCFVLGELLSISGTSNVTFTVTSSITTGSFIGTASTTNPTITSFRFFAMATGDGIASNFSTEPSAVNETILNAGDTITITVNKALGASAVTQDLESSFSVLIQRQLT